MIGDGATHDVRPARPDPDRSRSLRTETERLHRGRSSTSPSRLGSRLYSTTVTFPCSTVKTLSAPEALPRVRVGRRQERLAGRAHGLRGASRAGAGRAPRTRRPAEGSACRPGPRSGDRAPRASGPAPRSADPLATRRCGLPVSVPRGIRQTHRHVVATGSDERHPALELARPNLARCARATRRAARRSRSRRGPSSDRAASSSTSHELAYVRSNEPPPATSM